MPSLPVARSILLTATSAMLGGCYWPVASCEERQTRRTYTFDAGELTLNADGGFSVAHFPASFGSCRDFCAQQDGVTAVHACTAPDRVAGHTEILCDVTAQSCHLPTITEGPSLGSGRRPEGFLASIVGTTVGDWLAFAACVEEASVPAFLRLARELAAHAAPASLVDAARAAARDEIRHARAMSALSRRYDGRRASFTISAPWVRSLERMAIENAVEGCVGETLGATLAWVQAGCARDARVRAVMRRIASDETRHAELAWRVDGWARSRLPSEARKRVARARADAVRALDERDLRAPSAAHAACLGLPSRPRAEALIATARRVIYGWPGARVK